VIGGDLCQNGGVRGVMWGRKKRRDHSCLVCTMNFFDTAENFWWWFLLRRQSLTYSPRSLACLLGGRYDFLIQMMEG
jgi:hypothetical protein